MSPSEIGFLALGIVVGIAAGVMLLAVVRPRSPLRPVVRVTVTPNAMLPRDRVTIASGRLRFAEPMPGSPEEDALLDLDGSPGATVAMTTRAPRPADSRTLVPSGAAMAGRAVGIPIAGGHGTSAPGALDAPSATSRPAERPATEHTGIAVAERPAPAPVAASVPSRVDIRPVRPELGARVRPPVVEPRPVLAPDLVGLPIVARGPRGVGASKGPGNGASSGQAAATSDACADERTNAASVCAEADSARENARAMADRLREAQRAHADLQARVEEAGSLADPRRLAAQKERLHEQFQAAHGSARTTDDAEAAAREWLTAVSAANKASRDAAHRVQAGTDQLRTQAASLERLDLEAHAARIAAERAEADCRAAREALATCEEREHAASSEGEDESDARAASWPAGSEPGLDRRPPAPAERTKLPLILRVLHGDNAAREQLVAALAAGDPAQTAAWHVRIAKFLDAVTARAIEDGYLEVAEDQPFWRLFSDEEQRAIVQALSSLGFRYDGMRGFVDDRVPSARDLSLAVGYAGLDRMRIRTWPGESALAALFDGTTVRADLWLAYQADDLSLGRLEAALGPRAAGLGEVWDAWGRVRPAMLDEA